MVLVDKIKGKDDKYRRVKRQFVQFFPIFIRIKKSENNAKIESICD